MLQGQNISNPQIGNLGHNDPNGVFMADMKDISKLTDEQRRKMLGLEF